MAFVSDPYKLEHLMQRRLWTFLSEGFLMTLHVCIVFVFFGCLFCFVFLGGGWGGGCYSWNNWLTLLYPGLKGFKRLSRKSKWSQSCAMKKWTTWRTCCRQWVPSLVFPHFFYSQTEEIVRRNQSMRSSSFIERWILSRTVNNLWCSCQKKMKCI